MDYLYAVVLFAIYGEARVVDQLVHGMNGKKPVRVAQFRRGALDLAFRSFILALVGVMVDDSLQDLGELHVLTFLGCVRQPIFCVVLAIGLGG